MSKAPNTLLEQLHGELAKDMLVKLKSGNATASDLNAIRQFLKDNGIEAGPSNRVVNDIAKILPFQEAVNE
jgi:hypothetical protein